MLDATIQLYLSSSSSQLGGKTDTPDCLFLLLYRLSNARQQVLAVGQRVLKSVVGTTGNARTQCVNHTESRVSSLPAEG